MKIKQQVQYLLTSDDVKRIRVVSYLLISGLLGYLLAQIAKNDMLTVIFAPAINYALYELAEMIKENKD
jgi:hypothetical protein